MRTASKTSGAGAAMRVDAETMKTAALCGTVVVLRPLAGGQFDFVSLAMEERVMMRKVKWLFADRN